MSPAALTVPDMSDCVLINCVGVGATFGGDWPVGAYLAAYDPEANGGWGDAAWTADPAEALVFPGMEAAHECYRAVPVSRPVRPDGKPNRPLTIFAIEFVRVTAQGTTGRTVAEIVSGLDPH